ncbi:Uncharacterised protein [Serratia fonticola]|uniref:Uncharacterized protein n=1 Tax=Serratia fonticola TaxID=47917 RepID=A0A4U9TUM9_SERFO|nr:Uncharacterised protein [Serratia fonticola]
MKKNLLSLCLSLALTVGAPLATYADTPANVFRRTGHQCRHPAKFALAAVGTAGDPGCPTQ